ncbi:MAG: ATP-binding cassette domain-containing protein, partial [Planctomycetes bacterium]|nr:ATP-binding cassette domain-containing protein [Planctomycetota bacterium]
MSSDPREPDHVLEVRGLSKCYHVYERPLDRLRQYFARGDKRHYQEFWALRDLDLQVRRGETLGIIGRNGAGKSTLL